MYRKIKDYFRLFLYNTFLFLFLITPKILMKYILKFFAFFEGLIQAGIFVLISLNNIAILLGDRDKHHERKESL